MKNNLVVKGLFINNFNLYSVSKQGYGLNFNSFTNRKKLKTINHE